MAYLQLGNGFVPKQPVSVPPVPTPTDVAIESLLDAVNALRQEARTPPQVTVAPPIVNVPAIDLTEIVTAVNALKPGADAEQIANLITARLAPPEPRTADSAFLDEFRKMVEKIDWRMKATPMGGGGGVIGLQDNPNRQLGIVNVADDTRIRAYDIGDTITYVGYAPMGSQLSDAAWEIEKTTYDTFRNPTLQLRSPANSIWNNRASVVYT